MKKLNNIPKKFQWMLNSKEVTKYNPINRDEYGNYTTDEWTSFGDIGKYFETEKVLTYKEYKKTEDKYVNTVKYLYDYFGCYKIQLISKHLILDESIKDLKDKKLISFLPMLLKRRTIDFAEIDLVVRLILRGFFYAELHCKNNRNVSVRFGYDYYMYLNFPKNENIVKHIEKNIGLYVR